jgi:hypothetical protein
MLAKYFLQFARFKYKLEISYNSLRVFDFVFELFLTFFAIFRDPTSAIISYNNKRNSKRRNFGKKFIL